MMTKTGRELTPEQIRVLTDLTTPHCPVGNMHFGYSILTWKSAINYMYFYL